MARRIAKADLPAKTCAVCARPFVWRKKWRAVWNEVRYCSDACRRRRHSDRAVVSSRFDTTALCPPTDGPAETI